MRPLAALVLIVLATAACGAPGTSAGPAVPSGVIGPPETGELAAPSPGATRQDASGVEQVWVPAGTFTMGATDEQLAAVRAGDPPAWVLPELPSETPAHAVTISSGYWIDRTEVTNAAFQAFVDAGGYAERAYWSDEGWAWLRERNLRGLPKRCPGDDPEMPRRCITWFEAAAYAAWRGGTLPTEAEWEFAARGPESRIYPWGDEWDAARANVTGGDDPVAVGGLPEGASWVGAQDMAGNAMEWVADWLDVDYYATSPSVDPTGPTSGTIKVEKGGWFGSDPAVARSSYRHFEDPPTYGDRHIGFRVVSR
jgi:formylglycine-generating enzyme required for sulfatase activity